MNEENQVQEIAAEEFEMAVPQSTQQKAALHALAIGLLEIGNTPNKKLVKKTAKTLKRDVLFEIGKEGGRDILEGNLSAIKGTIQGIRHNSAHLSLGQRKKVLSTMTEGWFKSFNIGVSKLYG